MSVHVHVHVRVLSVEVRVPWYMWGHFSLLPFTVCFPVVRLRSSGLHCLGNKQFFPVSHLTGPVDELVEK